MAAMSRCTPEYETGPVARRPGPFVCAALLLVWCAGRYAAGYTDTLKRAFDLCSNFTTPSISA